MTTEKSQYLRNAALQHLILRSVAGWIAMTFLILVQASWGQSPSSPEIRETICGEVYFQGTGAPATGVEVQLAGLGGPFLATAQTDWSGRFRFSNVREGSYTISIEMPGYVPIQQTVQSVDGLQDIVLQLMRNIPPAQRVAGENLVSVRELRIPDKAREALQKGMERLQKNDAAGSLVQFSHAAAAFPDYYEAYYQMGVANMLLGQAGEAEQDFQKAIDLSQGRFADAQFSLGLLFCQRQRFAEAEPIIRRGLERDANSSRGHYALARALLGEGKFEDAEKSAHRAVLLNATFTLSYLVLAEVHLRQRTYLSVLDDLDSYLKLDPNGLASAWAKKTRKSIRDALTKSAEANYR
jgi:tetratricopeptide (TPR) repeat protein